jgi:hypothetical protein
LWFINFRIFLKVVCQALCTLLVKEIFLIGCKGVTLAYQHKTHWVKVPLLQLWRTRIVVSWGRRVLFDVQQQLSWQIYTKFNVEILFLRVEVFGKQALCDFDCTGYWRVKAYQHVKLAKTHYKLS